MSRGERTNTRSHIQRRQRLWRWRNKPLRRRDDVIEAWVVLIVWTVVALGGALVGTATARAADGYFTGQRAEKRSVRALLVQYEPHATAIGRTTARARAEVRWTDEDGFTRTGTTLVAAGHKAGSRVLVFTDRHGDLTSPPPTAAQAVTRAVVIGSGAALAFGGLVFGAGAVARRRLERRRIERWGLEWDLVGPRWGHRTG